MYKFYSFVYKMLKKSLNLLQFKIQTILMSLPDRRQILFTLIGAFIGILGGLFLLTSPTCHVVLLAILYIIGGEAAFIIWGLNKVNNVKNNEQSHRPLRCLFYVGLFAVLLAILILFFRLYLQMYTIQLTAAGLILGLILQWTITAKLYTATKKRRALTLLITTIILLAMVIPFLLFPPFSPEVRPMALAILCFSYVAVVMLCFWLITTVTHAFFR